jgi:hypothetical protein
MTLSVMTAVGPDESHRDNRDPTRRISQLVDRGSFESLHVGGLAQALATAPVRRGRHGNIPI